MAYGGFVDVAYLVNFNLRHHARANVSYLAPIGRPDPNSSYNGRVLDEVSRDFDDH